MFRQRNSLACTYMLMCVQGWNVGMSLRFWGFKMFLVFLRLINCPDNWEVWVKNSSVIFNNLSYCDVQENHDRNPDLWFSFDSEHSSRSLRTARDRFARREWSELYGREYDQRKVTYNDIYFQQKSLWPIFFPFSSRKLSKVVTGSWQDWSGLDTMKRHEVRRNKCN